MTNPVRIPSDVDREDRLVANLTGRQLGIFTAAGLLLYGVWSLTHTVLPIPVFAVLALPVAAGAVVLALGHRDGLSLDKLLLAALRQRLTPRRQTAALHPTKAVPTWLRAHATADSTEEIGGLELPVAGVEPSGTAEAGVVDLGEDGLAVVAVASTVNFALRTPAEQENLVTAFGRYLHSLTASAQLLVRTQRLELSGHIGELRDHAPRLPHPALEQAALEHADYLTQLGQSTDLLRRQVLLVLREPWHPASPTTSVRWWARRRPTRAPEATGSGRRAVESRLVRRLSEAVELLGSVGITLTPLDAGQATTVLATACNPHTPPPPADLAGPDEVITTPRSGEFAEEGSWA
ncbi:PrgI family protein [Saccharopolyspora hirsuta]|uniref:PrgI family protein n=1 Tax=Saccharopolyspora hirsuta TaxID=1837 RepID=A0A5M7BDY9_SACHI|nr:PrgI family protein [Saccharopolyspora hirsuta]KAA5825425.1 PrgI family protein [Saccharopolyspora hirsuta]